MSERGTGRESSRLLEWLGYSGARLGVWALGILPERMGLGLARGLGWIAMRIDWIHPPLARRNLDLAFGPELPAAERERILLESYRNLLLNVVEVVHAVRRARRGERPVEIEIEGAEHFERLARSGRGALFVSCHMGNWELCPIGTLLHGVPLYSIATPRRNPGIERLVTEVRESLGQRIVWKRGAFREAVRLLREGCCVGVLADQNQRKGSVFVDFFGVPASTTRGPALLARRAGVPLLPAAIRRLPGTNRHRLTVTEPIEPIRSDDADDDVLRMTEAYTKRLESLIREAPEQWLWHHRRWRTRPWRETRMQRDRSCIVRSCAASAHGIGPSLDPPAQPWEPMPTAIRLGKPAPMPVLRRRARITASPELCKELARLREQRVRSRAGVLGVSPGGGPPPSA
jgi:KDO2-lipid IV(A) lauroyltransferase